MPAQTFKEKNQWNFTLFPTHFHDPSQKPLYLSLTPSDLFPSWALVWISWPTSLVLWPVYSATSSIRFLARSSCSCTDPVDPVACRKKLKNHEREDSPVSPKAPDVRNAATARPIVRPAGTRTGLNIRKSGVVTASPIMVPVSVIPASASRVPPTGRSVRTARTWLVEGPLLCCCWE